MSLWRVVQFRRAAEERFTTIPAIIVIEKPTWYLAREVAQRFYQASYDGVVLESFPFHDDEQPDFFLYDDPLAGLIEVPWSMKDSPEDTEKLAKEVFSRNEVFQARQIEEEKEEAILATG